MTLSPTITPYRWYDKYYDQNRFAKDCDVCNFELITDNRHLLPFQFKRAHLPFLPSDFILRKCCEDANRLMLSEPDANFVSGSMSWVNGGQWMKPECDGIAVNTALLASPTTLCWTGLTIGKSYTVTFLVKEFYATISSGGGAFVLKIKNGATLLTTYNSIGLKSYTFTATATSFCFDISPYSNPADDKCVIQYAQITEEFVASVNDIVLDPYLLKLYIGKDYDYIVYCGGDLGQYVPGGCYYAIIKDSGGNYYYSEVITVKEFIPEKSNYIKLEWWNTCDIQDVVYKPIYHLNDMIYVPCSYVNRIYFDFAALTKPSYPFAEDVEKDGNQNENITFQRWSKTRTLDLGGLPEYIIDAITAIRLHDTIQYTNPLRNKQIYVDAAIPVTSAEYDVSYAVNDCMGRIELKMLLQETIVDETCCTNNQDIVCKSCKTIPEPGVFDESEYEWALVLVDGDPPYGLYHYEEGEWVPYEATEHDFICDDSTGTYYNLVGSSFVNCNIFTSAVFVSGKTWTIQGDIINDTFGDLHYSLDGGSTWLTTTTPPFTQAQFKAGVNVTLATISNCADMLFRIRGYQLGCGSEDFEPSNELTVVSPDHTGC